MKKILTIDDSKTVRTIIAKHLAQFPISMLEAENGEQGVERAREGSPDLILLDYNMPVMDGYHTLVELKTDPGLKSIPVLMVTTETSKETVVKLLKLGLNGYIAKPFSRELLLEKINAIVGLYNGTQPPPPEAPAAETKSVASVSAASPEEAKPKPAILAVDDKPSILQLFKEYVGSEYRLFTADCGKAALEAIEKQRYDYVFLDLSLPDMNGFDVLDSYVRSASDGAGERRVTVMTMRSAQSDILRASEAGVQVMYKPFTQAELKTALEKSEICVSPQKHRFLMANGNVRILDCPADKSSRFRIYAASLGSDIIQEIDGMTQNDLHLLIIKLGEGFLSHKLVRLEFEKLLRHVSNHPISIRLVADSAQTRSSLKQLIPEGANLPIDVSLECALSSIA